MEKVQAGFFIFPDFSDKCPACGGKDCAVRIGHYYRWGIDLDLQNFLLVIIHIPVARYLCKEVNKRQNKHKTFSLLPDTLIPYNPISIILMMYILQLLITAENIEHALQEIDAISPEDIFISEKMIAHLFTIIEQTRIKLILFFHQANNSDRAPPDFHASTINEVIAYLLNYPVLNNEHPLRGAYQQSVLYYEIQGSYHKNARFLFGTASQFCK